ncbi:MAG: hypothetical protein LAN63_06935 [Acidobacteriia bacterium]|nr:hypothetical protein [Terriglobia bacterium]
MTLAVILAVFAVATVPQPANTHPCAVAIQQDAPQPDTQQPPSPETKPDQTATPQPAPAANSTQPPETPHPASTAGKPESKPTPAKKSRKHGKKVTPVAQPGAGPAKVVVRNGSTPDPEVQLSPGMSQEQASHQRQNTTQLLANTEANLKTISVRQLNPSQEDMVKQIRTYMDQAKAAITSGDLPRARNLAFKAHLLSDELLKQ